MNLKAYQISGLRLKKDFDFMIKTLLTEGQDLSVDGMIPQDHFRNLVLDVVNEHRREIAKKYLVLLRDQKKLMALMQKESENGRV